MLARYGVLLLTLSCVTTAYISNGLDSVVSVYDKRFSFWPSVHNAAQIMRFRREAQVQGQHIEPVGQNEGGGDLGTLVVTAALPNVTTQSPTPVPQLAQSKDPVIDEKKNEKPEVPGHMSDPVVTPAVDNGTITNSLTTTKPTQVDDHNMSNQGVFMRGVIVFGGFLLLAVAYFIFYRRKNGKNDASTMHNINDTNQFRYGVLQSEDRRDKLELSRIPLTMETDDDEDEDLEIFDLEQKRKSLSYVNLQTNDEDTVFGSAENSRHKDNLLLDIEDAASDTLINWNNSGNKSIL